MEQITIIAVGSRGDVQPAVALGKALQARGHGVRVAAGANFADWIASHGLEVIPTQIDVQAIMESEGGLEWVEKGTNPMRMMQIMTRLFAQHGMDLMVDTWRACQGSTAVISSFTSDIYAFSIAEKLGAKHISAPLQPFLRASRHGSSVLNVPLPNRTSLINYIFARLLIEPAGWRMAGKITNRFRQDVLDLPPKGWRETRKALHQLLVVQGFSRHVVPHPPDWPANIHTAGYWFLDENTGWQPPPDLLAFLESGPPPVSLGFGSMTGRDPERITRLLVEAIRLSGQRAVLLSGWAGLGRLDLPESIYCLAGAPHHWLFPRLSAVVHHGGAGTTAAGLRAGTPTVIVPHMADQPFWGQRVQALGVGPAPISRPKLTAEKLAAAIRTAVEDPKMRRRADALAARIQAEDGLGTAVRLIESYLAEK